MLDELKKIVCDANLSLKAEGLVIHTWGNVSGIDRVGGRIVIKPSGVSYDRMTPADMVVVSLADGKVVDGALRPSSDTPTHLELYRRFKGIAGIVHTHSLFATAWAQAKREIPCFGTTHADYFYGPVPVTRQLKADEIQHDYEANTGKVIIQRFEGAGIDPNHVPAVLVADHGPFTWGAGPDEAVHHAVVLEHLARLAAETLRVDPNSQPIGRELLDKHFLRKHGANAYYGQSTGPAAQGTGK